MVEVREVTTQTEIRLFSAYNTDTYLHEPGSSPDIISDEIDTFNPKKNPAFSYCRVKRFLAWRDGKVVGRIGGIINERANEKWDVQACRMTRIDFIDDKEVSAALLKTLEDWARSEGMERVIGPIGFNDIDQEGMQIAGFDRPGPFFTIYNPAYYVEHMEAAGYEKDVDWVEYRITIPDRPDPKIHALAKRILAKSNLTLFQPKNTAALKAHIHELFDCINDAFRSLYGTSDMDEEMIQKYCKQYLTLLNPEFVKGVLDENNRLIAFGMTLPSLTDALKQCRGRLFPFGWAKILKATRSPGEVLDLILIAIEPEWQRHGLPAVIMDAMSRTAIKNGFRFAETGPELEYNTKIQKLWKFYEVEQHKKRRSWKKILT